MIADYYKFVESIAQADRNALIIFGIVSGSLLAWYCLKFLPATWQHTARLIAWLYTVLVLATTVLYSIGG